MRIASALAGALASLILPLITPLSTTMRPSGFLGEHLVSVANGVVWAAGFSRHGDCGAGALSWTMAGQGMPSNALQWTRPKRRVAERDRQA
jgi:hypothetical protein